MNGENVLEYDGAMIRPNMSYFITGNNQKLAEKTLKSICQKLRTEIPHVTCFCTPSQLAFYSAFIPPAFIQTRFSAEAMQRVFEVQDRLMAECDKAGRDANQREMLKAVNNRLLIIDRFSFVNDEEHAIWMKNPAINNGLRTAATNHITLIYCEIRARFWERCMPEALRVSGVDACMIVSSLPETHAATARKTFGAMLGQFAPARYFDAIKHAVTQETRVAVLSRAKAAITSGATEEEIEFFEDWQHHLITYSVPETADGFKFGDAESWTQYVTRSTTGSSGSASSTRCAEGHIRAYSEKPSMRYDERILKLLNTVGENQKLLVAVVPK